MAVVWVIRSNNQTSKHCVTSDGDHRRGVCVALTRLLLLLADTAQGRIPMHSTTVIPMLTVVEKARGHIAISNGFTTYCQVFLSGNRGASRAKGVELVRDLMRDSEVDLHGLAIPLKRRKDRSHSPFEQYKDRSGRRDLHQMRI